MFAAATCVLLLLLPLFALPCNPALLLDLELQLILRLLFCFSRLVVLQACWCLLLLLSPDLSCKHPSCPHRFASSSSACY
jgi:hypothetical protein